MYRNIQMAKTNSTDLEKAMNIQKKVYPDYEKCHLNLSDDELLDNDFHASYNDQHGPGFYWHGSTLRESCGTPGVPIHTKQDHSAPGVYKHSKSGYTSASGGYSMTKAGYKSAPGGWDCESDTWGVEEVEVPRQRHVSVVELPCKLLVIGDPGVGKTSFVQRYVNRRFSSQYRWTVGVDFALKVVRWSDNVSIKLQLWDIAGQERFTSMTRVYYRDAHACIIMFDLTNRGSFLNALKWKKDLDQKCTLPDGSPVPCMLLANKCDLGSREVDQAEIEGFCRKQDFIGWTEMSVKEGLMVEESMRFLLDDMIARYAERNPGVTDSEALDLDRKQTIYLQSSELSQPHSKCSCS